MYSFSNYGGTPSKAEFKHEVVRGVPPLLKSATGTLSLGSSLGIELNSPHSRSLWAMYHAPTIPFDRLLRARLCPGVCQSYRDKESCDVSRLWACTSGLRDSTSQKYRDRLCLS